MNPDPATNPTPETLPLTLEAWERSSLAWQKHYETALEKIDDLERALAEAKRENRKLTLELGAERMGVASRAGTLDLEVELKETKRHRDSLSSENERLKADKERLDWLENRKATFHCTSDAVDLVAIVPAVRNAEQHPAGPFHFVDFRRAIDHARTTQEGQGWAE